MLVLSAVVWLQNLTCVETLADAIGQKISAGAARRVAFLVEQQMCQNRSRDTDAVRLALFALKKKKEKGNQFE